MTESLPATAFVRVSRATFDPGRFAEVDAMNTKTSEYLIPAVGRLPGLIHFCRGRLAGGLGRPRQRLGLRRARGAA